MRQPTATAAALLAVLTTASPGQAQMQAQTPPPASVDGEVAAPVEITMESINELAQCRPVRARLPAQDELDLRVVNRVGHPMVFAAPDFLGSAEILRTSGLEGEEIEGGRFLVNASGLVRIVLRTPPAGEYHYSCYAPDQGPGSIAPGFLVVVPTGANAAPAQDVEEAG